MTQKRRHPGRRVLSVPFPGRKFGANLEELDITYRIVRAWRGACLPADCGAYVLTCQAHPERTAERGRPGIILTALLLAGKSPSRFALFRGSLSLADDASSDAFMRGVVNWLLGGF